MRNGRFFVGAIALGSLAASPALADFGYSDFSSTAGLTLVGNATAGAPNSAANTISLSGPASTNQRGAMWGNDKQLVAGGFQADFSFRILNRGGQDNSLSPVLEAGADGIALVIQNVANNVGGASGGSVGYEGIANSVAIEFDTFFNTNYTFFGFPVATGNGDSNGQHIAVHSNGLNANSAASTSRRGEVALAANQLEDGSLHNARVVYRVLPTPAFDIYLDNLATPIATVPFDLATELNLDAGSAFVGLTAATGTAFETHQIESLSVSVVPEPGMLGVLGVIVAMGLRRRR